ncbi:MAG: flagellar biosynthesis anti-sigma factor FlgM [Armatimonadetes bacterium]|nr:flagellar biosynthesis anti-sigma factor FlgM [Armatimonadota bacterium]
MKVSNEQIARVIAEPVLTPEASKVDEAVIRLVDADLVQSVTRDVLNAPDRDAMVAEIKARVDAGTYNVSADDIVDTMVRRAIADRIR